MRTHLAPLLLLASIAVVPAAARADGPIYLRSRLNAHVVDILEENKAAGAPVISYEQRPRGNENQHWFLDPVGDGYFYIRSEMHGMVLDTRGNRTPGAPVTMWPRNGSQGQQWMLDSAGANTYFIRNRANGFVLDIQGANRANRVPIIAYPLNRGLNQQWELAPMSSIAPTVPPPQPIPPPPPRPVPQPMPEGALGTTERGHFVAFHSAGCLNGSGRPAMMGCDQAPQLTVFNVTGRGVQIKNDQTGECLHSSSDGRFGWYTCSDSYVDQRWEFESLWRSGGSVNLHNAFDKWKMVKNLVTNLCLYSNADGRFGVSQCNAGYTDQYWKVDGRTEVVSYHSQQCLHPGGGVATCGRGNHVDLVPMGRGNLAVMVRHARDNTCLYSNRDGRFGWYTCNAAFQDQQWVGVAADNVSDPALRDPRARWRMLQSVHSGKCVFSNADGRFGLYQCTPQYTDQFWRLDNTPFGQRMDPANPQPYQTPPDQTPAYGQPQYQQPGYGQPQYQQPGYQDPPPPRVVAPPPRARDCGTGNPDPGCNESRDGVMAIDRDTYLGIMANLRAEPNEIVRERMIEQLLGPVYVTAQQFMQVCDLFRNDLSKVSIARRLAPRIVDRQRALVYGPRIMNTFVRRDFLDALSR